MDDDSGLWRAWLDNATVPAPSNPATRRRPLRRNTSGTANPASKTARRGGPARRMLVVGVAAIAVLTAVGVVVGVSKRAGIDTDSTHPYKIVTTAPGAGPNTATPVASNTPPAFCTPGRVGGALVSNTTGDLTTGEGAVAEYEYRYFARRDPGAVMEVTDSGPGVPSVAQVADGIAQIPVDAPWCVSVTPAGADRFETSVRYQSTASTVSWLLVITVAAGEGGYRVVRIEDKQP